MKRKRSGKKTEVVKMTRTMNETKTEVGSIETYFKWIIPNISSYKTSLNSKENNVSHSNVHINYYLEFHPYDKDKTHMSLFLHVTSSSHKIDVSARFNIQEMHELGDLILNRVKDNKRFNWGWDKFFDRKNISSLKDDTLTIECYLNLKLLSTIMYNEYNPYKINKQMLTNLNNLLGSGNFSDVILKTSDGTEFPVHKNILAMQSSVFLAMFQHDMLEKLNNTVQIDDIESNVLKAMLEFVYSNKFDKTSLILDKLLIASDKYDIKDLKTFCEVELCNTLTVDNAVDYLKLSDLHECKLLKECALNFITENLDGILKTNSFKTLEIDQPSLFTDILQCINDKKSA